MKKLRLLLSLSVIFVLSAVVTFGQGTASPLTIRTQTVLTGLSSPLLVTSAKDGTRRLFIVQQRGIIKVMQPGATTTTDFMNISSKVSSSGSERGLLGLAFHPQFATNSFFFVNYTRASDGATIVSRFKATNNNTLGDPNSEVIILTVTQPFSNHNGGMIAFGPDNNLYIGMGDGGSANDPGARSQNINDLLGKMLRITPSVAEPPPTPAYTNPPDNPYVGVAGADEIYAIGLRNPWRWSFDRGGTNQLWAGDVGQGSLEETSIITRGGNFGWRAYEGFNCTGLDPNLCSTGTNPINHAQPVFQYDHSNGRCSITGGYVYRGTLGTIPPGSYMYADYCSGEIFRWNGIAQTMMLDTSRLISSFGEDDNGELYFCGISSGTVEKIVRAKASADFDGDFRTDLAVFRPSTGSWFINNSSNGSFRGLQFGANGDIPTPEDFDGDNITDIAVFRPSEGNWYVFQSSTNTFTGFGWGSNGDIPAQGDYDGDAKADYAVFRPSNGVWYRFGSSSGAVIGQFGINGDRPVTGDYDGDGKYDLAVFRPSNGVWYSLRSIDNSFQASAFGIATDIPAQGDFDNDGKTDLAVYRDGVWYTLNSFNGSFTVQNFGSAGDIPVVGDYDGDGRDDIGVFRPSNGVWYTLRTTSGVSIVQFGANGDRPAPNHDTP